LAIRTLGDAIDASMGDLLGGTTGQVLAKATGTDMDFTWTTPAAGSSNVAGKNGVLNSGFNVWQRGTSGSASGTSPGTGYNADRWWNYYAGTITVSRQLTGDTTNLPFIQYCARVQRNSGQTSATTIYHGQDFETLNSVQYAGKSVTLSFYARKGANFSGASSNLTAVLQSGTGTDQHVLGGYTGSTNPVSSTATLTTTWQRFTYTGTVPTNSTQLAVYFLYDGVGTAGAADYFEVTGVQVEIAASASSYSPNTSTYEGELSACQRYYIRTTGGSSTGNSMGFQSQATTTTIVDFMIAPQTSMRTYPTSVDYSNIGVYRYANATNYSGGTITMYLNSNITNTIIARYTHGSAIFTINDGVAMNTGSNAATYIGFSAEL
jgi:hypothetical protein